MNGIAYGPRFVKARTRARFIAPGYRLYVIDTVRSEGIITYEYIAIVRPANLTRPVFHVTSERNEPAAAGKKMKEMGLNPADFGLDDEGEDTTSASHFFCVFADGSHNNHGADNRWAIYPEWEAQMIRVVEQQLRAPLRLVWRRGDARPAQVAAKREVVGERDKAESNAYGLKLQKYATVARTMAIAMFAGTLALLFLVPSVPFSIVWVLYLSGAIFFGARPLAEHLTFTKWMNGRRGKR